MKTLSSSITFFFKYIFSVIWIGGFGAGTLSMIILSTNGEMPKLQFLFGWVIGTLFIMLTVGRIKKVEFDGDNFHVSNYFKSEVINISKIKAVSGSILLSPELVWFKLREKTKFRQTIIFIPKIRLFSGFSQNPMVKELREKCGL